MTAVFSADESGEGLLPATADTAAAEAVRRLSGKELSARTGYREHKGGWGRVVSLDLLPEGASPKETVPILSLLLIFGCTVGMAVIAKKFG